MSWSSSAVAMASAISRPWSSGRPSSGGTNTLDSPIGSASGLTAAPLVSGRNGWGSGWQAARPKAATTRAGRNLTENTAHHQAKNENRHEQKQMRHSRMRSEEHTSELQ